MRLNLLDICRLLGAACVGVPPELALAHPEGAAIDSRAVKQGDLFFCLPGEHVDGHDFAAAAVEKGALAVVASRDPFAPGRAPVPVLAVDDPAAALGLVAAAHRKSARATIIGVTGTSGKTSVKEVLACVLGESGVTAKNHLNLNNQIGLPLSMLNAPVDAAYWVMEAGISKPGDMDELGAILRPDMALILNAGAGHVQELGDRGVAHYKASLLQYVMNGGHALVNADYPELVRESAQYGVDIIYFSAKHTDVPFYAAYLGPDGVRGRYHLFMEGHDMEVIAPFQGDFGAENVAAVGAVAHILGLTAPEIAAGFANAALPPQRFSLHEAGGYAIIDDSYNANPLSMARMLEAARDMAEGRQEPLVLVLGEMGELGRDSERHHRELGGMIAAVEARAVFWKGGHSDAVRQGLAEAAYAGAFTPVDRDGDFAAAVQRGFPSSGVVLFKGSRSNRLEELIAAFEETIGPEVAGKGRN